MISGSTPGAKELTIYKSLCISFHCHWLPLPHLHPPLQNLWSGSSSPYSPLVMIYMATNVCQAHIMIVLCQPYLISLTLPPPATSSCPLYSSALTVTRLKSLPSLWGFTLCADECVSPVDRALGHYQTSSGVFINGQVADLSVYFSSQCLKPFVMWCKRSRKLALADVSRLKDGGGKRTWGEVRLFKIS